MSVPPWFFEQAATIPYRRIDDALEVLLITTARKGRWIVPKGVIDPGRTAEQAARLEAFEEGGVQGQLDTPAVGAYEYDKWNGTCRVTVFTMHVENVLEDWPERDRRQRRWVRAAEAIDMVSKDELRAVLRSACEKIDS